jgi:shikimate kinase
MLHYSKTIVLVGIMGSGKSRVGRELAKYMKLPFVDSDREIEAEAGCSISEMFERFGETEFRLKEKKTMLRLLQGKPRVVASGGGGFIQPDIRAAIKEKAISVWLKADLHDLVQRVSRNKKRPLLKGGNVEGKLRELMEVRYPVYAEADITVVTGGQTPQHMARLIKTEIDRRLQPLKE